MKQLALATLVTLTVLAVAPAEHRATHHAATNAGGPAMLPGLTADARSANPGSEGFARPECVAFELGGNSRYECGDLQIRHLLPTTRELNKNRTPMLLYNSSTAHPHPVIGAFVSTPSSTTADSITASVAVSGTTVASTQFAGSSWGSGGVTRKIALQFDGSSYATAIYPYTLTITAKISGQYYSTSDTGSLVIINRSTSKYGAGWWLASHERFYIQSDNSFLWVGGDGSWRHYMGNRYASETVNGATGQDSIVYIGFAYAPNPEFKRILPTGTYAWYDLNGQLVQAGGAGFYNAIVTSYSTNSNGVVTRISLPPTSADSVLKYDFAYDGNGNLSQITSPGLTATQNPKRHTYVTVGSDGRLTQIMDPDSLSTHFGYSGSTALIVNRVDKRLDTLSFAYDSGQKLAQLSRPLNAAQTAVTTFCAAEIQGLAGVNCSSGPADSSAVATQVDGPRDSTDVLDKSKVWITRAGALRKSVDALGDTTLITYGDTRFLGLPTSVRYADGRVVQTWFNSRALADSIKDLSNCFSGQCATTRFQWDTLWAMPIKITHPAGDSTLFSYDWYANRVWQEDGTGATGRTIYSYTSGITNGSHLVSTVSHPSGSGSTGVATDSSYYDVFGNIDSVVSAEGRASTMNYSLAGGLARLEQSAGGSFSGNWVVDTTWFDAMDRPIRTRTKSVYSGHDSTMVRTVYDAVGNVTAVVRRGSRVTDSLLTQSTYDKANRKVTDVSTDGAVDSLFYDKAGNVITTKSRRGNTISLTYDALNRVITRILPSITYDSVMRGLASLQPSGGDTANTAYPRYPNATGWKYTIPADTQRYTYDAAGRLLTAKNRAARVTRTYASSGLLASERQQIMTWAGNGADNNYTAHDYTLQYSYDLDSRRTAIQHPSQLLPRDGSRTVGSSTTNAYDAKTGRLTTVTDPFGQTHRYVYSPRGDVDSVFHSAVYVYSGSAAPVTELRSYTLDGLMSSMRVYSPAGSAVAGVSTIYYDDSRRMVGTGTGGPGFSYSELGNLTLSTMQGSMPSGPDWYSCEFFRYDGLGNTTVAASAVTYGGSCSTPTDSVINIYQNGTGRLDRVKQSSLVLRHSYDSDGNLQFEYSDSITVSYPSYIDAQDRYSYYAADGQVMASDARWAAVRLGYTAHPYDSLRTAFEEYRYDALGRRVEVRSRKYCASGMGAICRTGTIRRTVWDGDQELHEITMPGDNGVSTSELENDTLAVTRFFPLAGGGSLDQDPRHLFGRVLYVFTGGTDSPVAIIRSNYVTSWTFATTWDSSWVFRPRTVLPVIDWQGHLAQSYFAENGLTSWMESPPSDTINSSVTVGMYTPTGGVQMAYGPMTPAPNVFGTLLSGKVDDAGTLYRRNRSYDPVTGRFTQEDPIGLAGGLNVYAYAGGDPINFSDPYGLKMGDRGNCTIYASSCGQDVSEWVQDFSQAGGGGSMKDPCDVYAPNPWIGWVCRRVNGPQSDDNNQATQQCLASDYASLTKANGGAPLTWSQIGSFLSDHKSCYDSNGYSPWDFGNDFGLGTGRIGRPGTSNALLCKLGLAQYCPAKKP